jgi:hypothetical protein
MINLVNECFQMALICYVNFGDVKFTFAGIIFIEVMFGSVLSYGSSLAGVDFF